MTYEELRQRLLRVANLHPDWPGTTEAIVLTLSRYQDGGVATALAAVDLARFVEQQRSLGKEGGL